MEEEPSGTTRQAPVRIVHTDDPPPNTNCSTRPCTIKGKIIVVQSQGQLFSRKSVYVRVYSSTSVDPRTGKGKLSKQAYLHHGKSKNQNGIKTTTYRIKLPVEPEFGIPGAFIIVNNQKHEIFLESATLEISDIQIIHFDCRSWVYPYRRTKLERIFFSNTSYLPNQTPIALMELRLAELVSLKEDGTKERKEWHRIYDYDYYNDLGHPDKNSKQIRPVLGGSKLHPYPRRGGTGTLTKSKSQKVSLDVHIPPDERLSPQRLSELTMHSIKVTLHFLGADAKCFLENDSRSFESFDEIIDMFYTKRNDKVEGKFTDKLKNLVSEEIFRTFTHARKKQFKKFPLPQILAENELAWSSDEEFGRQMLAGVNPVRIKRLKNFPPKSKNTPSKMKVSDIELNLEGLTLTKAMDHWRIFILDHHDYLLPFLRRINTGGVCAYASRTLFFLRSDSTLKPLAIELSLPGFSKDEEISRVFRPANQGTEAAIWKLAKAHVAANDSAYHHLISHWLHTHAVVEPFIIATRRQLSAMHPIFRLLDPHFKDTMHINALARRILINAGGIFEKTLFSGKLSMELSSELYKEWRFDEQALPISLVKRGLALEDPENPTGVQLIFQDYPYAADGLDIWQAIKAWVKDFCSVFYKDDDSVRSDKEIQAWWSEVRNVGHGDKCHATWWWTMTTLSHLVEAVTTLIWITSAFHASVNFGQYAYAGYPPNRPMLCRKFIPEEGTFEFAEFLKDPDKYFLDMLPGRFEMTLGIILVKALSQHTSDEVFLGRRMSEWTDNKEIQQKFKIFNENLCEIEKKIFKRNENPEFKNRRGPAKIPYELLCPFTLNLDSKGCLAGQGIPNSISI